MSLVLYYLGLGIVVAFCAAVLFVALGVGISVLIMIGFGRQKRPAENGHLITSHHRF